MSINLTQNAGAVQFYANSRSFGAVGMEWLRKVVDNQEQLASVLLKQMQKFVEQVTNTNHLGQIQRLARRFALVAVAGELASHFGLTGWVKGSSYQAAAKCFKDWLGCDGNREDRAILSQVRAFFESHGASRFDSTREPNNERIHNRAGFYKTDDNGFRVYMVQSEVYRKEICQGFEPKMVTKMLLKAGWITPGNDGKASQKPRVKAVGIPRCYVFNERLWSDEC